MSAIVIVFISGTGTEEKIFEKQENTGIQTRSKSRCNAAKDVPEANTSSETVDSRQTVEDKINVSEGRCFENSNAKPDNDLADKTKFFVHSSWLAVHSSYFRALFYCGMKETHSKEVVLRVDQVELQAHVTLIEAMYKLDILDSKSIDLVLKVLALADKYDVNLVFRKCKYVLIASCISLEDCEYILNMICDIPDCGDVRDSMEEFLVKMFSPLDRMWLEIKFSKLSRASLKLLLGSDKLMAHSENTVFVALMSWLNKHKEEIHHNWPSLLSLVRFELMTAGFMYDIVRHHPIARRLSGFNEFLHRGLAYHAFSKSRLQELRIKPVNRRHCVNNKPLLTWVIGIKELKSLNENQVISSGFLWCKGYRLEFKLQYNEVENWCYLTMYVVNMENYGHVKMNWTAKSIWFKTKEARSGTCTYTNPSKGSGKQILLDEAVPATPADDASYKIELWVTLL